MGSHTKTLCRPEKAYRIAAQENLELAAIQHELAKEPVE